MLEQGLIISTMKLALESDSVTTDFSTYVDYFRDRFFYPDTLKAGARGSFIDCDCVCSTKKEFTDWLVSFMKRVKILPKVTEPIYTDTYLSICLDYLYVKVRELFDASCLATLIGVHDIAISPKIVYFRIEFLCGFFSPEVRNEKLEAFNALDTSEMSTEDSHAIHVTFLNNLIKELTTLANS